MRFGEAIAIPAASDAAWAAVLLAVDPLGLGGAVIRNPPGPLSEAWMSDLRRLLPPQAAWRRVPLHVDDDRLLGGLDVAASMSAGRAMVASGLLAEADRGMIVLPMAEQVRRRTTALICAAMDRGEVLLERDGIARRLPARFGVIALDEGQDEDEAVQADLADRLAFTVFPDAPTVPDGPEAVRDPDYVRRARRRLDRVQLGSEAREMLCGTAANLGIESLRGPLLAQRAARAAAALAGRDEAAEEDLVLAARLVLLPRAQRWPTETESEPPKPQEDQPPEDTPRSGADELDDVVLAAARAALPPDLLARLQAAARARALRISRGRFGADARSEMRGRPRGVRAGQPRGGKRLHLSATLKAAAPWQKLRTADQPDRDQPARLRIRPEDLHVGRFKARRPTITVFVVDASGSSAAARLAEAKGAVELLLAECYVRRDHVALIAFRGSGAELLLPPTRALARARRELAGLPGGGGTPLATGLDAARGLAADQQRRGLRPVLVVMTDGRANVSRCGAHGQAQAREEALAAGRLLGSGGWSTLVLDTARRPGRRAQELASAMGALYLPLPNAEARSVSAAVQTAAAA